MSLCSAPLLGLLRNPNGSFYDIPNLGATKDLFTDYIRKRYQLPGVKIPYEYRLHYLFILLLETELVRDLTREFLLRKPPNDNIGNYF